jgi:hypothetical protein
MFPPMGRNIVLLLAVFLLSLRPKINFRCGKLRLRVMSVPVRASETDTGLHSPRKRGAHSPENRPATHSAKFPETRQERTQNFHVINLPFNDEPKFIVTSLGRDFLEDPTVAQLVEVIPRVLWNTVVHYRVHKNSH